MRKRNPTVTIRMNEKEYALLQQKIKASGQTQQAVILAAIENVDLMSAEVKEELNELGIAVVIKPAVSNPVYYTVVQIDPDVGSTYTQEGTDSVVTLYYD